MITTVIGNYPKIPDLPAPGRWRSAVEKFQKGQIDEAALRAVEDEVTLEVIREQVEAGIDLITDGQIRWEDGQTPFARRLRGFSINGLQRYFDTNVYFREPVVEGEVVWEAPITVADYTFARAHSPRPVKPVVTGPFTLAALSRNTYYPTFRDLVLALARALNAELRALAAAGAEVIQVDEPALLRRRPDYPVFAEAMGVLTDGVQGTLVLATYFGDVGGLYPQMLELPFAVLGLDFVAGHRNWDLLETAPFTKGLMAGILDARNTRLETAEEIVAAVERLTRIVPPERLMVAPSAGLEFLPRGVARRKLAALAEGVAAARRAGKGVPA
ncbi:MAG: methylcobamide--CoM methyltransferase [Armatimonadota bacterium]|nr:methylcobamide--CoM methyltransferase [Armatimonadota bacterium]MDR7468261.1 methylcobamide--CoM methyltransferase [Armatimonadota bacterium]MDR7492473.1 methylcobamide--CoM methyltransferase [Armatimonadota bacterium]MDR7553855.1 methylcobamide--CoM methyltransferase [Armatimonadota bacterium]MDR7558524.1 methylcobamide--CoM methyltransferase [Armatimonadota bacterium]